MKYRKEFEKRTGLKSKLKTSDIKDTSFYDNPKYVKWLESQVVIKDRLMKLILEGKKPKDSILIYNLKKLAEKK